MKKILTLALVFFALTSFAASELAVTPGVPNGANIPVPLGGGKVISLLDLTKISVKDFEKLADKKLGFFKRLSFKAMQHKLAKSMDEDGNVTSKKLTKAFSSDDHSTGFHLGGFALGFLLGLIGVLIAYIINDDIKANRRKWAWIGLGAAVVLSLIFFLL